MQRGLLSRHEATDLVAFGKGGERSAADLLRDVAHVARALPAGPEGAQVVLVIRKDRYALAVAILAAWLRDYVPVLPPELDRDAITALADAPETVCVLHDTASGIALQIDALLAQAERGEACAPEAIARLAGDARSYARNAQQNLEVQRWGGDWLGQAHALLEALALRPRARCATSVGSEHAHGIVLGVLAPLLAGAAFLRDTLDPAALGEALSAQAIDVLVTVPAHVPALLAGAQGTGVGLARALSALGALPGELAAGAPDVLGCALIDLAQRAPDVGVLQCHEPGRVDDASAALEARVEQLLRAQSGVRDAAAVWCARGRAARLCVALVADAPDLARIKALLVAELPAPAPDLDLLVVNRIRRDGIGRAPRNELLRQFGLRPDGTSVNFALEWGETDTRQEAGNTEHRSRVHVPMDYGYFDGHFTGYPILPGAAQLSELVLPCVRRAWPELGALRQMARLKFTGRIQPGETIDVVLSTRAGSANVDFSLKRGDTSCSAGSLSFAPPEAAR
jgi:hypothetical protein